MAINKERKEQLVAEYIELLNDSEAIFLTEYTGMDVKQMQQIRGEVRKVEGAYHVTKNTLLLHALQQVGKPAPSEELTGQLATGFATKEAPTVAKTLVDFANDEETFSIRGGILGEEWISTQQVEALAKLPTMDELRGQILGLIQAPARNIASTVAGEAGSS